MIRREWSAEAAAILAGAAGDDLAAIASDVEAGTSALFDFGGGSLAVLRVEGFEGRKECVIVAGAGSNLLVHVAKIEQVAREQWHCQSLRTHVQRRGLIRMYARRGWHLSHYILKKGF